MTTSPCIVAGKPMMRLSSGTDVTEAVPYLVGFHPERSAVLLSLRGPRHRLGLVMRADIPPDDELVPFAKSAARRLRRDGAHHAVVVVYPEPGVPPGPAAHHNLVAAVEAELARHRIRLAVALCVGDGRWWSYSGCGGSCCPSEGTPLRQRGPDAPASVVSATAAFAGLNALPDRQALVDTLRPVDGEAAAELSLEFERVRKRLGLDRPELAWGCDLGPHEAARAERLAVESVQLLHLTVRRFLGGDRELSDGEVARLVLGLQDVSVRDTALSWIAGEEGDAASALWQELARRSVPPYDIVPLTLVAWAALSRGDGALAGVAVERARERDPRYPLAALIEEALEQGVHPRELRRLPLIRHRQGNRGKP
jgi:hypothetical protein